MSMMSTIDVGMIPGLRFVKPAWEGEEELPSWAGFMPRKSRAPMGESGDGRVKIRVRPPKSRAPVITGRVLLFLFVVILGLKAAGIFVAKMHGPMGKVSWWIVGVPAVCYFLVKVMAAIAGRRATAPTEEQVGAYGFLKQNEVQLGAAVLKAVFEEYPRLRKGFGKDEWEEMGQRILQVNQTEEMKRLIGPENVQVLNYAKDGRAYVWFEFNCNWDQKGFGVLTHGMRIVEIGPVDGRFEEEAVGKDGGVRVGKESGEFIE